MGLNKSKIFAILITVVLVIFGIKILLPNSGDAEPDESSGGGTVVTDSPSPSPTEKPTAEEPSPDSSEKPSLEEEEVHEAATAPSQLSLEGEAYDKYEALPPKEVIKMGETAAEGVVEYLTTVKGESPKNRQKRISKYIHSQSNLMSDDLLASGIVEGAAAVINGMELIGADGTSAVFSVSMNTSLQLAPQEGEGQLSSVTTSRALYYVLVKKTDEGWKITDITEEGQ